MIDPEIQRYLNLSTNEIRKNLLELLNRQNPLSGKRQVDYNPVETLLCYGLFEILDPHKFGGNSLHKLPKEAKELASFFHRSPGSITNKMLNLDGLRKNSARGEVMLYAYLSSHPESFYRSIYSEIIKTARNMQIGENLLPDFLGVTELEVNQEALLGQEELPTSSEALLKGLDKVIDEVEENHNLGTDLTEKLVARTIRLAQHRFSKMVLANCNYTCVFCGFRPSSLPVRSGLLRASHIKPWAVSDNQERVDVRNGLVACPTHDAAFDKGYLTVNEKYQIDRANILEISIANDPGVEFYFKHHLNPSIALPNNAKLPKQDYLEYHRTNIFRKS